VRRRGKRPARPEPPVELLDRKEHGPLFDWCILNNYNRVEALRLANQRREQRLQSPPFD
jgi:hypothetical protein